MGLSLEQSFTKQEAIKDNIALLLRVLWQSDEQIPYKPLTRISFHFMVLFGAIGGFRPGILVNWKYRDVRVELVRDPGTDERSLVATFTVYQNKLATGVVRANQKHM